MQQAMKGQNPKLRPDRMPQGPCLPPRNPHGDRKIAEIPEGGTREARQADASSTV